MIKRRERNMKGNKLFLLLVMMSLLVLAACGGGNNDANANTNDADVNNEANEETEQGVEVDKGLMNVEMTIPLELLDEDSEELEKDLEENWGGNIVDKDDTSVTVKMRSEERRVGREYRYGYARR